MASYLVKFKSQNSAEDELILASVEAENEDQAVTYIKQDTNVEQVVECVTL